VLERAPAGGAIQSFLHISCDIPLNGSSLCHRQSYCVLEEDPTWSLLGLQLERVRDSEPLIIPLLGTQLCGQALGGRVLESRPRDA
jgi:hypothetical protein